MHVISLDSNFKVLSYDANFIYVGIIKQNKILIKVCYWRPWKKYMSYNLGQMEYLLLFLSLYCFSISSNFLAYQTNTDGMAMTKGALVLVI